METMKKKKTFVLNSDNLIKRMKHSRTMGSNLTLNYNSSLNKNLSNIKKESNKENLKHLFVAHKINFKDKINDFYKKGANEIFNNENYFFATRYHNNIVKVGNDEKRFEFEPMNININKKLFIKKRTNNVLLNRKISLSSNQIITIKNKLNDSNMSILSKYDYKNPQNNNRYIKRPSIYFNNNGVSDTELKSIFQKFKEQNKKSRNENKNYFASSSINFNSSISNEINKRISLQEKILNTYKKNERKGNNLINRIKKKIKKEKEDILINQVDKYRDKKEKIINSTQRKKNNENYSKVIQWLYSLRQYNNKINKNNSQEKNNENEIHTFNNNSINFNKTINREQILDNYINKLQYSFGNNSNLYSDIESNIRPLYALIIPQDNKNKEIIKNNNDKSSLPVIIGKSLLDYEINISKYLEGKKKKIIEKKYQEDEIKPLIFIDSKGMEKYHIPRSVTNAFDLHLNK